MKSPCYVYFKLFDNCNARCNMCQCWHVKHPLMPPEHYLRILDGLAGSGVREVRFTGGEPLLYRHLPSLLEHAAQLGAHASVITNGWLLPARVDDLAAARCYEVVVSVDGTDTIHDAIRAMKGLFGRCMDGMALVNDRGIRLGVNTVLQAAGIEHLPALAAHVLDPCRRPAWWHLIPVRDEPALRPSSAQVAAFVAGLPALRDACARAGTKLVASERMFENAGLAHCTVPQDVAYVDAESGGLYGCNMLAYVDKPMGSLLTSSLAEMYGREAAAEVVRQCATAAHSGCGRCDPSSRAMNLLFIERSRSDNPA